MPAPEKSWDCGTPAARLPKLLNAEWKGSKDADSEHAKTAPLLLFHSSFSNLAGSLHCSWCATIPRPSILMLHVAAFSLFSERSLGKQGNAQVASTASSCHYLVSDRVRAVEPVMLDPTSWLESTGSFDLQQNQAVQNSGQKQEPKECQLTHRNLPVCSDSRGARAAAAGPGSGHPAEGAEEGCQQASAAGRCHQAHLQQPAGCTGCPQHAAC